jgi:uncharacterized membrane protein
MKNVIALFAIVLFQTLAFAHQGHEHAHSNHERMSDASAAVFKKIGGSYTKNIRPIFLRKCMDCHSDQTKWPWYYKIPGVKQAIDRDISEAREHLDFSNGFPFKSHASPSEDLAAIRDSINNDSMPPFSYRLFHWSSFLTEAEKKIILNWVKESEGQLKLSK